MIKDKSSFKKILLCRRDPERYYGTQIYLNRKNVFSYYLRLFTICSICKRHTRCEKGIEFVFFFFDSPQRSYQ